MITLAQSNNYTSTVHSISHLSTSHSFSYVFFCRFPSSFTISFTPCPYCIYLLSLPPSSSPHPHPSIPFMSLLSSRWQKICPPSHSQPCRPPLPSSPSRSSVLGEAVVHFNFTADNPVEFSLRKVLAHPQPVKPHLKSLCTNRAFIRRFVACMLHTINALSVHFVTSASQGLYILLNSAVGY